MTATADKPAAVDTVTLTIDGVEVSVPKGTLIIRFRDRDVSLGPGEMLVVPKGVEHAPYAQEETHILLIEPRSTAHTGDVSSDQTVALEDQEWI